MRINLPNHIDDGRLDWALDLLESSRSAKKKYLRLNWKDVKSISPAGMAILCCLFDAFIEQSNRIDCLFVPKHLREIPVIRNMIRISEFSTLPPPEANSFEDASMILRGRTSLDPLFAERFREKFAKVAGDELSYDCTLILNELMQNTVDHSTAERYYVYSGIWENEFHAGVLDMGISIPAKMQQRYDRASDLEYLELALEEGITTRRRRSGGVGLAYFFHFLKRHEGKLTIMSRGAQVRRYFKTRRTQRGKTKFALRGTWCFARFSLKGGR
ncbi:MAG: hypothetical protein WC683_05685 [bacterium]